MVRIHYRPPYMKTGCIIALWVMIQPVFSFCPFNGGKIIQNFCEKWTDYGQIMSRLLPWILEADTWCKNIIRWQNHPIYPISDGFLYRKRFVIAFCRGFCNGNRDFVLIDKLVICWHTIYFIVDKIYILFCLYLCGRTDFLWIIFTSYLLYDILYQRLKQSTLEMKQ